MTEQNTIDRVTAALLRALEFVEKYAATIEETPDNELTIAGILAGAAMVRERAVIEVNQEFKRGALWTAKHSHGGRYVVEHLDGTVLEQTRGRGGRRYPIYYKTQAAAERRAFALNEAIRKAMSDVE